MGKYTILRNSQLEIQLASDYQDNGWSFDNGIAIHEDCNSGSIENIVFVPEADKEYVIVIQVSGLTSGYLDVYLGGVLFGRISEAGYYELTSTTINNDHLIFDTDLTNLQILSLQINEGKNPGETIIYDSMNKRYQGNISLHGDLMQGFLDELIVFKNGQPWIQDRNSIRNTFFGVKYPSVIKFYCNINYAEDKDFYNITINGSHPWRADITSPQREGKPNGQRTRIKPGNFKFEKGKYVADILRDMNDPRFTNELQALLKGAEIQGKWIEVTLTNNEEVEVFLLTVDIDVSIK